MIKHLEKPIKITKQNWAKDTSPLVSIDCITYNHEDYIRDAIEGFLMQKTTFPVEILIHDDASTDKTAKIVHEYETKYPELIKPIYQTENQYSKKKGIIGKLQRGRAKGKYIALCEGDDYWTNPLKLQEQVDFMEKNPGCTLCFHGFQEVDAVTGDIISIKRNDNHSRYFEMTELIVGGGDFIGTQTMLLSRNVIKDLPHFFEIAPSGDYPLVLIAKAMGNAYYINEDMACYRINNTNSAMGRVYQSDFEEKFSRFAKTAIMLHNFNEYTSYKYNRTIKRQASNIVFKKFRRYRLESNFIERIKILFKWKKLFTVKDYILSLVLILPIPASRKQLSDIFSSKN
ncbi:MAG: glycosyltransferase [Bacteroidales bacterium]|nr:glycosyltransferase [Bacteroidales bacterium]